MTCEYLIRNSHPKTLLSLYRLTFEPNELDGSGGLNGNLKIVRHGIGLYVIKSLRFKNSLVEFAVTQWCLQIIIRCLQLEYL